MRGGDAGYSEDAALKGRRYTGGGTAAMVVPLAQSEIELTMTSTLLAEMGRSGAAPQRGRGAIRSGGRSKGPRERRGGLGPSRLRFR